MAAARGGALPSIRPSVKGSAMRRPVSSALDALYRFGAWVAGALLVALCGLVLWSIVARAFGLYAGGATEFAGYAMATSTFLALAYTFRTDGHIRVALLIDRASGAPRRALELVCLAFMAAVAVFVAVYMTRLALDSYAYGERSEGADAVLLWQPQAPVALGACILALAVLHTLVETAAGAGGAARR